MKNFSKILIFIFMFSLVTGIGFTQNKGEEEFLSPRALRNTVPVNNFHNCFFKTNIGWKKVPAGATKLRDLKDNYNAYVQKSDVLERQSLEEPYKFIYTLAPSNREIIKDPVPAVYGYKAKINKSFYAVDERTLMKKKVITNVDAGEKPLIVKVTKYDKIIKTKDKKWRYLNRK